MVPITTFIENFKSGFNAEYLEDVFTNGNCYHFALILINMYGGEIVYDPHESHFVTKLNNRYYDITGEVDEPMDEYTWDDMEEIDPNEYDLVERTCVYKL